MDLSLSRCLHWLDFFWKVADMLLMFTSSHTCIDWAGQNACDMCIDLFSIMLPGVSELGCMAGALVGAGGASVRRRLGG